MKDVNLELKFRIGRIYYDQKKYSLSKVYLSTAANKNHAEAQLYLGAIYDRGYIGKIDYVNAFSYFLRAANSGNNIAQYNLGIYYFNGKGRPINKNRAKHWLDKSCNNGYNTACSFIKKHY